MSGRKKSIVSTSGLQIEQPVANNTLLNKSASSSTSLYQQCSSLRNRLLRVRGFSHYFTLTATEDNRQSTDPVTELWDLFSTGIPLCYIFDQLPSDNGFSKINNSEFDEEKYSSNPERLKKHAIALFAMQVRNVQGLISGCEPFTVTDLWNRESTDGLVKVINTVTAIVNHLPPDAFDNTPSSPSLLSSESMESLPTELSLPPANAQESARNNIIRELVETERKYVQDLEIMQKYANALAQNSVIDQDTIHLLFPGLNKLLNFQRKFLIRFESTAELPWNEQRWGQLFLDNEEEFVVYEPYCGNYTNASELMLANVQALSQLNHMINANGELPAFLIKPIQRLCKYPLLIDSLIKATAPSTYTYYEELKRGSDTAKRIADKINEAQRRAENELTVRTLRERIDDWKGHHIENFGELLLDDIFVVNKTDLDREYHVFLFEKIILCCKDAPVLQQGGGRKPSKTNSILKKQAGVPQPGIPASQKKTTPLLLKGRIYIANVTQAVPQQPRNSMPTPGAPAFYPLAVWWKGDDDLEFFTLRCRREDQMRQWQTTITRLIKENVRRIERSGITRIAQNSTNPAHGRQLRDGQPTYSPQQHPYPTQPIRRTAYNDEQDSSNSGHPPTYSSYGGPNGYPPHDGFDMEEPDEDDYEDYPVLSSGRGTPMGSRRNLAISMHAEREPPMVAERPRAHTEDINGPVITQWRNNGGMPPPPLPSGISTPGLRPGVPRNGYSYSPDGKSIGLPNPNGLPNPRPPLRNQLSQSRLRDAVDYRGQPPQQAIPPAPIQMSRSRSASQPQSYAPKVIPPPLPTNPSQWNRDRTMTNANKRGSGSSQSTGDSSEYSPNSSSPVTPFGSSDSSLGIRISRSQQGFPHGDYHEPKIKVKVHFHEDIFVIQVHRATEYDDLVEKVGRKIRLCGPRRDDGPLRVKYRDEDGDMVSLGSTEDVQMAFEQWRPGGQVTLFVT